MKNWKEFKCTNYDCFYYDCETDFCESCTYNDEYFKEETWNKNGKENNTSNEEK